MEIPPQGCPGELGSIAFWLAQHPSLWGKHGSSSFPEETLVNLCWRLGFILSVPVISLDLGRLSSGMACRIFDL